MRTTRYSDTRPAAFARAVKCLAAYGPNPHAALAAAEKLLGADADEVRVLQKAAVGAARTTSDGWASDIAEAVGNAFFGIAAEQSVHGRMTLVPSNVRLTGVGSGATAGFVAEGAPAPILQMALEDGALMPTRVVATIVISAELARLSDPRAETIFQRELEKATINAIDAAMLSDDAASGSTPAGLIAGVTEMIYLAKQNCDALQILREGTNLREVREPEAVRAPDGILKDLEDLRICGKQPVNYRLARDGLNFAKAYLEGDACIVAELAVAADCPIGDFVLFSVPNGGWDIGRSSGHMPRTDLDVTSNAHRHNHTMISLSTDTIKFDQKGVSSWMRRKRPKETFKLWMESGASAFDDIVELRGNAGNGELHPFKGLTSDARENGRNVSRLVERASMAVDDLVNEVGDFIVGKFDDSQLVKHAPGFKIELFDHGVVVRRAVGVQRSLQLRKFSLCLL